MSFELNLKLKTIKIRIILLNVINLIHYGRSPSAGKVIIGRGFYPIAGSRDRTNCSCAVLESLLEPFI